MMGKDNIAAKVIESGGKLSVKSALNPILWFCAIVSIPSLCGIITLHCFNNLNNLLINTLLVILICLPVITVIVGFMFLLFVDRDKLQSEEYQLKKMSLDLIQIKGQDKPILLDSKEIKAIINPE